MRLNLPVACADCGAVYARAFSLVELVIVVVVMAVVAAVAVVRAGAASTSARLVATHQTLTRIERAVQMYYADYQAWPRDAYPQRPVRGMRFYIEESVWTTPAPIGGVYDRNGPGTEHARYGFNIAIDPPASPADVMPLWRAYEQRFDDGSTSTGRVVIDRKQLQTPVE